MRWLRRGHQRGMGKVERGLGVEKPWRATIVVVSYNQQLPQFLSEMNRVKGEQN